jgi:uncharacterized protein
MQNVLVWTDIPVLDLDRAMTFYSAVLGAPVTKQEHRGFSFALLPGGEKSVSGCLACSTSDKPSDHGPLLYFNCDGRLDAAATAVESNGGKILQAKHEIGPYGSRVIVLDSEGNRIALHSN